MRNRTALKLDPPEPHHRQTTLAAHQPLPPWLTPNLLSPAPCRRRTSRSRTPHATELHANFPWAPNKWIYGAFELKLEEKVKETLWQLTSRLRHINVATW